jgi:hypothetical protein
MVFFFFFFSIVMIMLIYFFRSFDPRYMHGTMLPSALPLDEIPHDMDQSGNGEQDRQQDGQDEPDKQDVQDKQDKYATCESTDHRIGSSMNRSLRTGAKQPGRVRISRGSHLSVRSKDKRMAEKYEKVHALKSALSKHWRHA